MQLQDGLFFIEREFPTFDIGTEVIRPPQPAALPTSQKPSLFGESPPTSMPVLLNVLDEHTVFFGGPGAFFEAKLITAGSTTHIDWQGEGSKQCGKVRRS